MCQCPSCRVSCPSRRNLRKDDAFNAVIAAIYPDINKAEIAQEAHIQEVIKSYNVRKFGEIASKGARQQKDQARRSTKRPASPPPSSAGHAYSAPLTKRPRNPNKPEPISICMLQHPILSQAEPNIRDVFYLQNKFVRTSRYITVLLLKKWLQLKLVKPKLAAATPAVAAATSTSEAKPEAAAATESKEDSAPAAAAPATAAAGADESKMEDTSAGAAAGTPAAIPGVTPSAPSPPPAAAAAAAAPPQVRFVLYVRAFDLQLLDPSLTSESLPGGEVYVPLASDLTLDYIEEYMWNSDAKATQAQANSLNAALALAATQQGQAADGGAGGDPTPVLQRAFRQAFVQCTAHRKAKVKCPEDCTDRMAAWHEYLAKESDKFNKYKEAQKQINTAAAVTAAATAAAAAAASTTAGAATGGEGSNGTTASSSQPGPPVPALVSLPNKKRRLVLYYSVVGADGQLLTDAPVMAPEVVAKYVIPLQRDEDEEEEAAMAAADAEEEGMQVPQLPATATQQGEAAATTATTAAAAAPSIAPPAAVADEPTPMQMDDENETATPAAAAAAV